MQVPDTAARFPMKLVESLERAVRCTFDPPTADFLRPICRGTPGFLARQPVTAMHRMLDVSLPDYRQQSQMLASCHAELSLWRLLLRVAPRAHDADFDEWAEMTCEAHVEAGLPGVSSRKLKQRKGKQAWCGKAKAMQARTVALRRELEAGEV